MKLLKKLLKTLYPNHYKCAICGKEIIYKGYDFCDDCFKKLPYISSKVCVRCGEPINTFAKLCLQCKNNHHEFKKNISCFTYESPISDLILNYKFHKMKYLYKVFIPFLIQKYIENGLFVDLILPVPLHEKRLKERGFNQSELISNELAKQLKIKTNNNILIKVKNNPKQSLLSLEERKKNVENAFLVSDKNAVKNKTILLIDDVYTTGSTLDECCKVLKKAKAKEVYCLTIAHAKKSTAI